MADLFPLCEIHLHQERKHKAQDKQAQSHLIF